MEAGSLCACTEAIKSGMNKQKGGNKAHPNKAIPRQAQLDSTAHCRHFRTSSNYTHTVKHAAHNPSCRLAGLPDACRGPAHEHRAR